MRNIEIYCENTKSKHEFPLGTTLQQVAEELKVELKFKVCGALVNNKVRALDFDVVKPKNIRFIDYSHPDGMRIYIRSLFFLMYVAVKKVCPKARLVIDHAISRGYYCEVFDLECDFGDEFVEKIKNEMTRMVLADLPFTRKGLPMEEVLKAFSNSGLEDKVRLYSSMGWLYSYVYYLDGYANYFYGHLLPSTFFLQTFNVERFNGGLLLRFPSSEDLGSLRDFVHQEKLFDIFREHKSMAEILGVRDIGSLNQLVEKGKSGEIIKVSEALHEKKIAQIATSINEDVRSIKLVLIAGPSSSGKTTFSKRLAVQLALCGYKPLMISMDNYFVDREDTPVDENGNYDFESLDAIDVNFFNKQLNTLFSGGNIELPKFNFQSGKRYFDGEMMHMKDENILIVEGIHGLNPELTADIDQNVCFKIFVSALTAISIDDQNPISTTDNRLMRRMIRDYNYRGYSALETIRRWPSVRKGEEKNIFPYQENADVMFNSSLLYGLGVLKKYGIPLLKSIPENQPEFSEALRLLKFLDYFKPIDDTEIPPTSLMREFLGGSSFSY